MQKHFGVIHPFSRSGKLKSPSSFITL